MSTTASSVWRSVLAGLAVGAIALALVVLENDSAAAQPGAALTMRAQRAQKVDISGLAYHPKKLTVAVGSRVSFVNSDNTTHTATRAGSFDTGHIKPGGSVVVRFSHRGTFAYHCTIHSFMHGKIVVG